MRVEVMVTLKGSDGTLYMPGEILEDPLPGDISKELKLGRGTVRVLTPPSVPDPVLVPPAGTTPPPEEEPPEPPPTQDGVDESGGITPAKPRRRRKKLQ